MHTKGPCQEMSRQERLVRDWRRPRSRPFEVHTESVAAYMHWTAAYVSAPSVGYIYIWLYQSGSGTDVANKGTLHLDHIHLDVMRSVIKKLWKL